MHFFQIKAMVFPRLLQVHTCAEDTAISTDEHRSDIRIVLNAINLLYKFRTECSRQRVSFFRPVQNQVQNAFS